MLELHEGGVYLLEDVDVLTFEDFELQLRAHYNRRSTRWELIAFLGGEERPLYAVGADARLYPLVFNLPENEWQADAAAADFSLADLRPVLATPQSPPDQAQFHA